MQERPGSPGVREDAIFSWRGLGLPVQFPPAEIAVYPEAVSNYRVRYAIAEAGLF